MLHKLLQLENIDVKFDEQKAGFFSGYASAFNGVDSYGDTIFSGAYSKTLESRKRPVQLRWNHYGDIIGKFTLLKEDDKGLYVEGELTPNHSKAADVYASMKHQAIGGMSIGYRVVKGVENKTGGLDLHEIELIEISIVESPADLGATIDEVKTEVDNADLKTIEKILRDAGFSRSRATQLVFRIKALSSGDQDSDAAKELDAVKAKLSVYEKAELTNAIKANILKLKGH